MKLKEIKTARSVLRKEFGFSWPLFLIKCSFKENDIFKKTQWSKGKGEGPKFVKRLSLLSAIYLELQHKFDKEKAFETMGTMIVPIGLEESLTLLRTLRNPSKDPLEMLESYHDLVDEKGVGRFGRREVTKNADSCHRVVTTCPFHAFFTEAGTPELTKQFCEVDREFYSKAFPELKFSRGSSWENTIAYGKNHCEFIFEKNK
jgi:hypothetical protein